MPFLIPSTLKRTGCTEAQRRPGMEGMLWGMLWGMRVRLRGTGMGLCPPASGYLSLLMTSSSALSVSEQDGLQVA